MLKSDNTINPSAWYFRVADVAAPVLAIGGAVLAVVSFIQFLNTF